MTGETEKFPVKEKGHRMLFAALLMSLVGDQGGKSNFFSLFRLKLV